MARFDEAFKDEVRTRNDIVEVVSSYVKLERRGNRFVGLCPFHGEKTPSFHVIPDRQIYHCFGCKVGGDVFSFVQDREHVTFYEAVVSLAKRAGIPCRRRSEPPRRSRSTGSAGASTTLLTRPHGSTTANCWQSQGGRGWGTC